MAVKIGIELEGHLIDGDGTLSNRILDVIGDLNNKGDIIPELSRTMWEVVSPPEEELDKNYHSFKHRLKMLKKITDSLGLRSISLLYIT